MPGMNGIETSKRIVELTRSWRFPPVIVGCSADSSQATQKEFLNAGVSLFLNKPISSEALRGLQQHLSLRRQSQLQIHQSETPQQPKEIPHHTIQKQSQKRSQKEGEREGEEKLKDSKKVKKRKTK